MNDLGATETMHRITVLFAQRPDWALFFWVSNAAWAIMELWLLRRDTRAAQGVRKDRGSRYVLMVLIPAGVAGAFGAPHVWPQANIVWPAQPTFYAAIACIWIGIAVRLWAIVALGRFFRTSVALQTGHELVTSGPYRVLRHPAYTGALLTMIGIALANGNWLSILVCFGCVFIAIAARIVVEERALAEHFGADFAAHKRRTWAILPFLW